MTAFSMRFSKRRANPERRALLASLLLALALCAGWLAPRAAHAQGIARVEEMEIERDDEGVFLTVTLQLELPPLVQDALDKGIPMFFVAEAALMRDRWYWRDKTVAASQRYLRLAYLPLTRRWRLNVSSEPIGNAGLGVSLTQHYDSIDEALVALSRISRWKVADADLLERDARYWVDFSFRLDLSQLPRPFQFQIGTGGEGEWTLSINRSQRLPPLPAQ